MLLGPNCATKPQKIKFARDLLIFLHPDCDGGDVELAVTNRDEHVGALAFLL